MGKLSNLTVAYFSDGWEKNTTNQFLVTCYTLIVDEVDCEFHLLSVTGVMKQKHHTNHPNFRKKKLRELNRKKKNEAISITYKNCLIRKSPLSNPWIRSLCDTCVQYLGHQPSGNCRNLAAFGPCGAWLLLWKWVTRCGGEKTFGSKLQNISRWWQLKYFMFTPTWGRWTHFDEHIF